MSALAFWRENPYNLPEEVKTSVWKTFEYKLRQNVFFPDKSDYAKLVLFPMGVVMVNEVSIK